MEKKYGGIREELLLLIMGFMEASHLLVWMAEYLKLNLEEEGGLVG